MTDKNSSKQSDNKENDEAKNDGKGKQKLDRIIPVVDKKDRNVLPETRIDFDADKELADE